MTKINKLSGVQKAAMLFITLGPEISAGIIKKLPDIEIQKITYEIANMTKVNSAERKEILDEFMAMNQARDYILEGGIEYAKSLLSKALGIAQAKEIIDKVSETAQQFRPFALARKTEGKQLFNLISNEHPQTIAVILCYLQKEKAGQILSELTTELQIDVAYRIASMSNTSPIMIKEIEKVLDYKLSSVLRSDAATGGINALVNILNQVDRSTEKNITEGLISNNAELAEKIKNSMFVFEDIINLGDISIQRVLRDVDAKELALALKGCSEEVSEVIYRNQSKRASASLKEDIEFLGPVRLVDVEKAQQKIVLVIRKLDETGEIILTRGGSDAIIE